MTLRDAVGATSTSIVALADCSPVLAVTVVWRLVVSVVRASPLPSVTTLLLARVPASAVNETGTPGSRLPLTSVTVAMRVTVPPIGGRVPGLAFSTTAAVAAPPIRIMSGSAMALPEIAPTSAVPDRLPALRRAVAVPLCVRASTGSIVPRVVVKVT